MSDDNGLLEGWRTKPLNDVAETQLGKTINPREKHGPRQRPYLRNANVQWDQIHLDNVMTMHFSEDDDERFRLLPGDLLICEGGIVGRGAIWTGSVPGMLYQNALHRVRPKSDEVTAAWLLENFRYMAACGVLAERARGNTILHLSQNELRQLPIVMPPRHRQDDLVAALGEVRSLTSSASTHLASSQRAIARFRQSVLAAACSGRLTADWRADHPDARPTPPTSTSKKRRGVEDSPLDLELPELPESYELTTIGAAAKVLDYGTSKKAEADTFGVPMLRMGNIQDGRLDTADLKYCTLDREIERLMLRDGDLLFNRTNSPELVGKSAVFREVTPMTFASYLIRARFAEKVVEPDFVNYWINSAWGRMWARHVKTDGVSQSNINASKLGAMPLPLPPFEEQREIVRRTKALLQTADMLLAHIDAARRRVNRSSQAVLAKAFQGELTIDNTGDRVNHERVSQS